MRPGVDRSDTMIKIGIIGGSGLDDPELLEDFEEIEIETPFGKPESPLTTGTLGGRPVVILARHGRKHAVMPGRVNYRANVRALKDQGCTHVLASTACGSLREEIEPGHLVFPDAALCTALTLSTGILYIVDTICSSGTGSPFPSHT